MTCTEEYKEHIEYTFHAFCKIVIRNASYTALRTWSRKHKREISLDYITDEKHYPLGTTDEYFKAPEPDEEYIVHLCGDTVILSNGLLVQALSRLPAQKQEMLYLSFFKRMPQHEIGRRDAAAVQWATISEKPYSSFTRKWRDWRMRNNELLPYDTIVQATSGEPEAVNTVLQYYGRRIRYASRISGQADKEAEDFITETLLKALFKFRFSRVSPPDTTE